MSVAAGAGMDGDLGTYDKMPPPPRDGVFTQKSQIWTAQDLEFIHDINGEDYREIPKAAPRQDGLHYQVPADQVKDWAETMYGPLPEALTARPRRMEGMCCPPREYTIARHMFGDAIAVAKVDLPPCICLWQGGCAGADVTVDPVGQVGGRSYRGVLKRNMCAECLGNETVLEWDTENKPYMMQRAMSTLDSCKLQFCMDVWIGWRGSTTAVPQRIATYDSSIILNICFGLRFACRPCQDCLRTCCSKADTAPRFARSEDLRRVVAAKYDYEFSCRNIAAGEEAEHTQGEFNEESSVARVLPRAHNVDALYSTRLYHDIVCGKPMLQFANDKDALHVREAAVDVRYRGSINHMNVSEDDHLVVLAGLIMQAVFMFPAKDGMFAWNGPADHNRGYIRPRSGYSGQAPSNAV